jgi:fused signal recognition particle receptor
MFEGLRKKLSEAVKGFIKKEEKKEEIVEEPAEQQEEEKGEQEETKEEVVEEPKEEEKPIPQEKQEEKKITAEQKAKPQEEQKVTKEEKQVEHVKEEVPKKNERHQEYVKPVEKHKEEQPKRTEQPREEKKETKEEKPISKPFIQPKKEEPHKKSEPIKLSFTTKLKSVFLGRIKLSEPEIENFLEELKVSMLESDVSYDTTEQFAEDLHSKLSNKEIESKKIREEIVSTVRGSLLNVLYKGNAVNIDELIKERKISKELPVIVLFLGPNGAGKTTTVAKMAHHFKSRGVSNVLSASDTFRAAAIEQIEHHAKKIGVPVIKSSYGADPASIAFDSIAYARAHNIDLVLIDSAGRQETNKSLINEIQKMVRVAKPDVTIFVGESTAGNQIAEQIKEFNKFVKIDGIILTKLDCDAKGGGALSISHTTGIPILFFGIGEGYDQIIPYNPNYIVDAILPEGG